MPVPRTGDHARWIDAGAQGKRKGYSLAWNAFVSGEAALATALNASLMVSAGKSSAQERRTPEKPSRK
jgi:hypothetical protein